MRFKQAATVSMNGVWMEPLTCIVGKGDVVYTALGRVTRCTVSI